MIVKSFITGPLATNSYVIYDNDKAVVIDAGEI